MDSILQILHKMDLVSGFIRFYKIQLMETHSRVMKQHNFNTMLRTMQFKTICLANAFMEKNCSYKNLIKLLIAQNVIKICILIYLQINNYQDVMPALLDWLALGVTPNYQLNQISGEIFPIQHQEIVNSLKHSNALILSLIMTTSLIKIFLLKFVLAPTNVLIVMNQKDKTISSALLIQLACKDIKDLCARRVIMTMAIS